MRIKIGNRVYLQAFDMEMFHQNRWDSIDNFRAKCKRDHRIKGNSDYDFCYYFEDEATIRWIRKQYSLMNYDSCRRLSDEQIGAVIYILKTALKEYNAYHHSQNREYQYEHAREFQCEQIVAEYEIFQLQKLLEYRNGKVDFEFPPDYDPDGMRSKMA